MKIKTIVVGYLRENCYVVSDDNDIAVVIDPGDEFDKINEYITDNGLFVRTILITHGHFDHIGAVVPLMHTSGARLYIGEGDADRLTVDADFFAREGDRIEVGDMEFYVTETPGHSPGGVCYRLGDTLFTGDTLFHDDIGRTDLPRCDHDAMLSSLRKLRDLPFDDLRILPGHEEESTLAHERQCNEYLK